jgi:hypothetical protein
MGVGFALDGRNCATLSKIYDIGQEALQVAAEKYSTGYPDYIGGSVQVLGYNNRRHGDVMGQDADAALEDQDFDPPYRALGVAVANSHDVVQCTGRGSDERQSAAWFSERMLAARVSKEKVALGRLTIRGTEPVEDENGKIVQLVNYLKFDSPKHEKFAKVVVSADLSETHRPISLYLGCMLYVQRQGLGAREKPQLNDFGDHCAGQVGFLQDYVYPDKKAGKLFATHRSQVIRAAEFLLGRADKGEIDDFDLVLDWALRFKDNPNMHPKYLWDLAHKAGPC